MVYKEMLCYYSEYFQRALQGYFRESEELTIDVRHVTEATFRRFQQWLYEQPFREAEIDKLKPSPHPFGNEELEGHRQGEEVSNEGQSFPREKAFDMLLDLYAFADQYDTRRLRRDVMTTLIEFETQHGLISSLSLVVKAFEQLPSNSAFCRYLVKTHALAWCPGRDDETDKELRIQFHPDFILGVLLINTQRANWCGQDRGKRKEARDELWREVRDCCNFHEHTSGGERVECRKAVAYGCPLRIDGLGS